MTLGGGYLVVVSAQYFGVSGFPHGRKHQFGSPSRLADNHYAQDVQGFPCELNATCGGPGGACSSALGPRAGGARAQEAGSDAEVQGLASSARPEPTSVRSSPCILKVGCLVSSPYCGWLRNPFRTTWKPWFQTIVCWYLQGNHPSRVS